MILSMTVTLNFFIDIKNFLIIFLAETNFLLSVAIIHVHNPSKSVENSNIDSD